MVISIIIIYDNYHFTTVYDNNTTISISSSQ